MTLATSDTSRVTRGSGLTEQKVRRSEGEKVSVEEDKTGRPSDLLNFSPSGAWTGSTGGRAWLRERRVRSKESNHE